MVQLRIKLTTRGAVSNGTIAELVKQVFRTQYVGQRQRFLLQHRISRGLNLFSPCVQLFRDQLLNGTSSSVRVRSVQRAAGVKLEEKVSQQ